MQMNASLLGVLFAIAGCSSPSTPPDAAASSPVDSGIDAFSTVDTGPRPDTGIDAATVMHADAGSGISIGEWTDSPGTCPSGSTRVDITTVQQMEDASRGDAHADGTCFFVHDGTYTQRGGTLPLYSMVAGTAGHPVVWVGESRGGVIIHGRATFEAAHVSISNMTFDLTGYAQTGAFNTITVLADDITISHVTLTGDCMTGLQGGHIEVDEGHGPVTIDSCLVERFGQCHAVRPIGRLDHGIYLAAGHDITITNNVVRGNSSRGIQLNTQDGVFGTLTHVIITNNRIYENGHADYEDGMVLNGNMAGGTTGTIDDVVVRHNLFYRNYYSGIRFSGNVTMNVIVSQNTFFHDGMASSGAGRSEINLDTGTPGLSVTANIFVPVRTVLNACAAGTTLTGNVAMGDAAGSCISSTVSADPMFTNAASDDYTTTNPAVASYGAYAH